jgi:DNA polymerase III subunit delta
MQVKVDHLAQQLTKSSLPIIWVAGDEPLLVQEASDLVRGHARQQGYATREVLDVGAQFDWNLLLASVTNLSLFGDRKLIDLRLGATKFDDTARKALQAYAEAPGDDNLLLITSHRIEKATQTAKWFKMVESQACFVEIWPVSVQQMPGWIRQRLQQRGMTADADAVAMLSARVEGNLLAASQEIEKLAVLMEGHHMDVAAVAAAVADNARFSVFGLIDAAMEGKSARVLKIISHLRAEACEPLFILNMLCRETRALLRMRHQIEAGQAASAVMQTERVWSNRTAIVSRALQAHSCTSLGAILEDCLKVDLAVKGVMRLNPWDELTSLLLRLSHQKGKASPLACLSA